jgi:LysM repeat protein
MKWRDWQLLIILVLLGYIAVSLAFLPLGGQEATSLPTPQPTARGALPSPAVRIVLPTSTLRPSRTPVPAATQTPMATPTLTVAGTPTSSPEPEPTATPTIEILTHTIENGDNLISIAEQYGVTVQAIVIANNLANPDLIYIGQTLSIPLSAQPSPSPTPSG